MYVCLCHGVTDTAIRQAASEGVSTFRELTFKTGCGSQCGSCAPFARSILKESLVTPEQNASPNLRVVSAA